jgi:hypothetical protein
MESRERRRLFPNHDPSGVQEAFSYGPSIIVTRVADRNGFAKCLA